MIDSMLRLSGCVAFLIGLGFLGVGEAKAAPGSELSKGYAYRNEVFHRAPWSVHVLQIDRKRADLELTTTLAQGRVLGLGPMTDQLRTIPSKRGRPIAAINGDFFYPEHGSYAGDPRGLQILDGELVSAPDGSACFWMDTNAQPRVAKVMSQLKVIWPTGTATAVGLNEERTPFEAVLYTPRFGTSTRTSGGRELILEKAGPQSPWLPLHAGQTYLARVREVRTLGNTKLTDQIAVLSLGQALVSRVPALAPDTILKLSLSTSPALTGVQTAIGGGPQLVRGGAVESVDAHKSDSRHPRTAVGWNSKHIFFVAVDGRQRGLSIGMTLPELGAYLVRLGCDEGINLDGGGSVEMWVEGQIVNSPCYGYERSTANSLVLVQTEKGKSP